MFISIKKKLSLFGGVIAVLVLIYSITFLIIQIKIDNAHNNILTLRDTTSILNNRFIDHMQWMNDLLESIIMDKKFTGQTDHTKCSFGRWYYGLKNSKDLDTLNNKQLELFHTMEGYHEELHKSAININNTDNRDTAFSIFQNMTKKNVNKLQSLFEEFINENVKMEKKDKQYEENLVRTTRVISILSLVLLLSLIITIITFFTKRMKKSISKLENSIFRLSEGYLNNDNTNSFKIDRNEIITYGRKTMGIGMNDEFDIIIVLLERLRGKLQSILEQVIEMISTTTTSSEELMATSENLSSITNEQAANLEEITASLEQMGAGLTQSNSNTRRTNEIAQKTTEFAQKGKEIVTDITELMSRVSEKIQVIDSIANQTNLLSLNASIEAARAGVHGKGFAVVSNEIKKLSQVSLDAANEIKEFASHNIEMTENITEYFKQIHDKITETSSLIDQIAGTMQEQSIGMDQINKGMNELNIASQNNAGTSEELTATATSLTSNIESLEKQVNFFKT